MQAQSYCDFSRVWFKNYDGKLQSESVRGSEEEWTGSEKTGN